MEKNNKKNTTPESRENQNKTSEQNYAKEVLETIKTKTKKDALDLIARLDCWDRWITYEIENFSWLDKEVAIAVAKRGFSHSLSDRIQYFNLQESDYKEIAYQIMEWGNADAILRNMSKFTWLTENDFRSLNNIDVPRGRRSRQTRDVLYKIYEEKITITPTPNITIKYLTIPWWSNERTLYIDREKNETYFQITSDCYSCSTCEKRIKHFWYKTSYHFYQLNNWKALYQKLSGVPIDDSIEFIENFLHINIENIS